MIRALTKLLLLIYGLSIVSYGVMDLGHEVLHQVKNNIHSHEHTDHHHIHDHNALLKMDTQHPVSDTEASVPIYSYFLFFEPGLNFTPTWNSEETSVSSELITKLHCGYATPLTLPPHLILNFRD